MIEDQLYFARMCLSSLYKLKDVLMWLRAKGGIFPSYIVNLYERRETLFKLLIRKISCGLGKRVGIA